MPEHRSIHHEGGGRARARFSAGVFALGIVIVAGCSSQLPPPAPTLTNYDSPSALDLRGLDDARPAAMPSAGRSATYPTSSDVRTASYIENEPPATTTGSLLGLPDLTLPTLKLATDGPVASLFKPTNGGVWSPDQAVLPYAEFRGDLVTVHHIRNSVYRTVDDYTVRYYDKTFDLRKLKTVDFIVIPFDDDPAIAHVALSFGFGGNDYLVSSVEIRKRKGQSYSALAGFFNQYTLMYVLNDEHDLFWKESIGFLCEVYLYHTTATPKQAQELFVDVMRRVDKLYREPEFYNSITNNCTTNVRDHINRLVPDRIPYDYRILLPGYSDHYAYDLGLIAGSGSFEETREKARINYKAYLYRDDPELSRKIRE